LQTKLGNSTLLVITVPTDTNGVTQKEFMAYRQKLSKKGSKRLFSKTASKTNSKNLRAKPMRGGIRL